MAHELTTPVMMGINFLETVIAPVDVIGLGLEQPQDAVSSTKCICFVDHFHYKDFVEGV